MTITTIQVEGYHIAVEMSCSVPVREWETFKSDLTDNILDALYDEETSGTVDMYYTEEGNDTDEEGYEVDVDVKWYVIDWKSIADKLYKELKEAASYKGEGCWGSNNSEYDEVIGQYEKYNSYYGTA